MTAPTVGHELRRELLGDVADLAGYLFDVVYADDLLPDVVRLHTRRPALFVGDAKDTETAGCTATRDRLSRYIGHAGHWVAGGFEVSIALCHPLHTGPWDGLLVRSANRTDLEIGTPRSTLIDRSSVVTWAPVLGS